MDYCLSAIVPVVSIASSHNEDMFLRACFVKLMETDPLLKQTMLSLKSVSKESGEIMTYVSYV